MQIAFQIREEVEALLRDGTPLTLSKKKTIDEKVNFALRFLDKGIYQFPEEWRCYWAAAYILELVRDKQRAAEYLDKGLENVPAYDEQGRARLEGNRRSVELMRETLTVVPDSASSDSSANDTVAGAN